MPHLIWSPTAIADVQRLYRFLAPKNENAAKRAVKAIRAGVKTLAQQPKAGRASPEAGMDFREWPIDFGDYGYVVLYRFAGSTVVVVNVRHGREAGY